MCGWQLKVQLEQLELEPQPQSANTTQDSIDDDYDILQQVL